MKKLLSVLMAVMMLLTMPLMTGIARAYADNDADTATPPADGSVALEMEDLDPATLHIHKLGEVTEEDEEDGFDPAELEITDLNKVVRASIFLDGKSTIDQGYDTQGIANNSSAVAYVNKLLKDQSAMQAKIESELGHKLTVKWNLTILANAIAVEVPYKDIFMIRRIEGVKSVELETQYEAPEPVSAEPNTANTSENMVGAQYAWNELGYTGAGSRVAIIDTGLDTDHQSVNADAFNHAIELVRQEKPDVTIMTQNDLNSISTDLLKSGSHNYLNAKIPYAYNYVDGDTRVNHQDSGSNHGSHVAGIAAANRFIKSGSSYVDAAKTVGAVGMAPDAQILVMKVFGTGGGAYDSDYFAALEDAIVLGADAANLSLGSGMPGFTYASSSYQAILKGLVNNTTNNHLVLSISAGNSYSWDRFTQHALYAEDASFHTGGSPGSFIYSMGVAAAQNTLTTGTPLVFNGSQQVFYSEDTESSEGTAYTNPAMTTVAGSYSYVYIDAVGNAADYQTVNSAVSLSGKIVIVNRGSINFTDKGNNAVSYSPKALIVANNAEGTIHMALDEFTGTFPYVAITLKDAEAIKAASTSATAGGITYYTGTVQVTTTQASTVAPREDAEITDFSSWGVPGSLIMKPEITAPGGDIYSINGTSSSDSGSGTDQYISYSGTSMAAPHITGLSAVLMQYLKENTPANEDLMSGYSLRAIANSLLMSTATPMFNSNAYLSILQQGSGLVEVSKAIEAKSVIMMDEAYLTSDTNAAADGKVKVELGDDPERNGTYNYSFTVYNLTDETLEFELGTDLFTQRIDNGDTLSHKTTLLPEGGVTYEWNGEAGPAAIPDVYIDDVLDEKDAQAILDLVTGNLVLDENDHLDGYDFSVADLDGDELITSYDAYRLLNWEGGAVAEGYVVGPHDKAEVTVHIALTDAQKATLDASPRRGAWLEGFTYVTCVTADTEDVSYGHEHSIPILGYYGSFTDPSMFDTNSYTEALYGNDQSNYSGNTAEGTNYMRISTEGTLAKFSGNPYKVEDDGVFPTDRLAIRSDSIIKDIAYNMIRNAGGTGFAVTKLDADGKVTDIVTSSVLGQEVEGLWYYVNGGSWQNTMTKVYSVNKALKDYNGIEEGDKVRVGFYAIPEYNCMKVSGDMTDANAGILTATRFEEILTSNKLGKGAFMGFDFTVDDTAPEVTSATLNGNTLSITASDDRALAYVAVLSLDGTVKYAEVTPGTSTYTVELDASDAIANAQGYVAAFAGDYAGNEAAKAVQVNNNTHVEKTVYVLTDSLKAGEKYLVVDRNTEGAGHGLAYTNPTSTNATTAQVLVYNPNVQAGNSDTKGQPYIESADAASTGIWTAANGITLTNVNGSRTWYMARSNTGNLTINTSPNANRRNWTYDATNSRLACGTGYYLRYYNNTFSLNNSTSYKMYLYVETTISYDIDPYSVSSVTVTPETVELYKGDTANLTAKVMPMTVDDRTVTWSSANNNIATVDEYGTVTGIAAGTTTIRATSNKDNTKFGECEVTVVAINKELSAAIWDEEGNVFFSYFNANNLPNWTKRHTTGTGVDVTSAFMQSTSNLYAATNDLSSSQVYTVNRTSYAMTLVGENYVVPFGMARVLSGYERYGYNFFMYGFAKYLIVGRLDLEEDGEYDDNDNFIGNGEYYVGMPWGLFDLTTSDVGDAYAVAVCARNINTSSGGGYYFLDETGKIWQTNLTFSSSNGFSFSSPTLVYDTGVTAGLQYNSIYYDGTNLYWTHQDGDYAILYILANANTAASRKFYRAGNFGENVWPAAGLYTNGSVAPASVEPGDEIMSEGSTLNLKPLMSREELMTADVMARFAAEAEKFNSKSVKAATVEEPAAVEEEPVVEPEVVEEEPVVEPEVVEEEPVVEPEVVEEEPAVEPEAVEEPAEEPEAEAEPEAAAGISRARRTINGTPADGAIPFSESEASTNGYFSVDYGTDLIYVSGEPGETEGLLVSINNDEDKEGLVSIAYAKKETLPAGTTIATLTFRSDSCVDEEIVVQTWERGEDVELDENVTITFTGTGHDWQDPTYEWIKDGDNWTCIATRVCSRDDTHTETETVTAVRSVEGETVTYTATFENEAFEVQTKTGTLGYYLAGSINEWAADAAHKFTANPENAAEYMLPITLAEGDEFKAVQAEIVDGETTLLTWYPDGMNNNYIVGANQAGDVTVYFRPDGQGGDGWHYGYLYIAVAVEPTPITIRIVGNTETVVYDGTQHSVHGFEIYDAPEGITVRSLEFKVTSVGTDVGTYNMGLYEGLFSAVNTDPDVDVLSNYIITYEVVDGWLKIEPAPVTIRIVGNTETVVYDGTQHSVHGFEIYGTPEGITVQSDEFRVTSVGTEIGTYYMGLHEGLFHAVNTDPDVDVLKNYDITYEVEDGWLKIEAGPRFTTTSLILSGQIGVKFFINLEAIPEADRADTYVTFTITGQGQGFITERADFDVNNKHTSASKPNDYGFICRVSPIQMADLITATYHYGENQAKTITKTYAVKDYFEAYDKVKSSFATKLQAVVESTADYGHYTQLFLSQTKPFTLGHNYADDAYQEMDKYYSESYNISEVLEGSEAYAIQTDFDETGDIVKITQSLSLDSEPIINVYFWMSDTYGQGNITVMMGSTPLEATWDAARKAYKVQITNISAHLLGNMYTLTATTDNNSTATVKVSALSYVYALLTSDTYKDNTVAQNAAASIYYYYKAAYAYKYLN